MTDLERVVQSVVDRARSSLHITRVKTLLGYKRRPKFRHNGGQRRRFEAVVEGPVYDLTVFKLHFDKLTLKVYTKGEPVLRVEAVAHNVVSLRCPRSLPAFPEIVTRLREMLERFLGVLACVDVASISCHAWDTLRAPSRVGETRVLPDCRRERGQHRLVFARRDPQGSRVSRRHQQTPRRNGFTNTSLSLSTRYQPRFFDEGTGRLRVEADNSESTWALRSVTRTVHNERHRTQLGLDVKLASGSFDYFVNEYVDDLGNPVPATRRDREVDNDTLALFVSHTWSLTPRTTFDLGARLVHFTLSGDLHLAPRASVSHRLREGTTVSVSAGVFRQEVPLTLLSRTASLDALEDRVAYHVWQGLSQRR